MFLAVLLLGLCGLLVYGLRQVHKELEIAKQIVDRLSVNPSLPRYKALQGVGLLDPQQRKPFRLSRAFSDVRAKLESTHRTKADAHERRVKEFEVPEASSR